METESISEECCPPFDPQLWDNKEFLWDNKLFIKTKVFCLFNMPLNFGGKMRKLLPLIEKAGAVMEDGMVLAEQTSMWNMNLFVAVNKGVSGIENVALKGRFVSKVYEGSYREMGKWIKDFAAFLKEKDYETGKWYQWYTACPKCAKKYGKNYVVFITSIE